MKPKTKKRTSGCPISFGLDVFGDKWTLLIIRDIMLGGKRTYSEFLQADEGIATNILICRLKQLENEAIVEKSRDPNNRRSFVYHLTQKGRDLAPVILEIIMWSGAHDDRPNAQREAFDKILRDRNGFEAELRKG